VVFSKAGIDFLLLPQPDHQTKRLLDRLVGCPDAFWASANNTSSVLKLVRIGDLKTMCTVQHIHIEHPLSRA
jgi:hypothetical protein